MKRLVVTWLVVLAVVISGLPATAQEETEAPEGSRLTTAVNDGQTVTEVSVADHAAFDPHGGAAAFEPGTTREEFFTYDSVDPETGHLVDIRRYDDEHFAHPADSFVWAIPGSASEHAIPADLHGDTARIAVANFEDFDAGGGNAIIEPGTPSQERFSYATVDRDSNELVGITRANPVDHPERVIVQVKEWSEYPDETTGPEETAPSPSPSDSSSDPGAESPAEGTSATEPGATPSPVPGTEAPALQEGEAVIDGFVGAVAIPTSGTTEVGLDGFAGSIPTCEDLNIDCNLPPVENPCYQMLDCSIPPVPKPCDAWAGYPCNGEPLPNLCDTWSGYPCTGTPPNLCDTWSGYPCGPAPSPPSTNLCDYTRSVPATCGNPTPTPPPPCTVVGGLTTPGLCGDPLPTPPSANLCDYTRSVPATCGNPAPSPPPVPDACDLTTAYPCGPAPSPPPVPNPCDLTTAYPCGPAPTPPPVPDPCAPTDGTGIPVAGICDPLPTPPPVPPVPPLPCATTPTSCVPPPPTASDPCEAPVLSELCTPINISELNTLCSQEAPAAPSIVPAGAYCTSDGHIEIPGLVGTDAILDELGNLIDVAGESSLATSHPYPELAPDPAAAVNDRTVESESGVGTDVPIGEDDRRRVQDTRQHPFSAIALFKNPGCTGFIIGYNTIATAAHCLYNSGTRSWKPAPDVYPSRNGIDAPHRCDVVHRMVSTSFFNGYSKDDWGAMKVSCFSTSTYERYRWIERRTGFFAYSGHPSGYVGSRVRLTGYPAMNNKDAPPGMTQADTQWWDDNRINDADDWFAYYKNDTSPGQSGAPVYGYNSGCSCITAVAIHKGPSNYVLEPNNHGRRFTNEVFSALYSYKRSRNNP